MPESTEKETVKKEKKEVEVLKFQGFDVKGDVTGTKFKGKQEIVESFFKEKGIPKDVSGKVFDAVHELHCLGLDFCAEQVPNKKKPVSLELPVKSGLSITSKVKMVEHFAGVARTLEDGTVVPPIPSTKYGGVQVGMDFSVDEKFATQTKRIAADIKAACEDFVNEAKAAKDKAKEAEAGLATPK